MPTLQDIITFCDNRTRQSEFSDFPGAINGLQFGDPSQTISKIGAAVDAGTSPFQKAAAANIDCLIVHHGLYWESPQPMTGHHYTRFKTLFDNNLAVYASHLPLDAHPEIGNNALISKALNLQNTSFFYEFEGQPLAALGSYNNSTSELKNQLKELFPHTFLTPIEFGSKNPTKIAVCSGSGGSLIPELLKQGTDTLITGELKQSHFNLAQELSLNLYPCGHYATETFGVNALAQEVAAEFNIPHEFISETCPL